MKAINNIMIVALLLTAGSCVQNYQFILKGKINESFNGQTVVLFSFDEDTIQKVDTTIICNGVFEFKGKENIKDIGIITVGNYPDTVISQIVILQKGEIEVSLDNKRIGGTPLNNLFQGYLDTVSFFNDELKKLINKNNNKSGLQVDFGTPLHQKYIESGLFTVNFKKKNIHNIVGQYFFETEVGNRIGEDLAFPSSNFTDSAFYIIYNEADEFYKQKKWVQEYIKAMEKQKELTIKEEELIGNQFIDFSLTNQSDKRQNISDFIGKSDYTLLDFWASWCGPCIASFSTLKELYEKYDRKSFEIVGISLDINKNAWISSLNTENLPWPQLIAGTEEINKELMENYSFSGIPFTVLVNKEGKIIGSGYSVEILKELIK